MKNNNNLFICCGHFDACCKFDPIITSFSELIAGMINPSAYMYIVIC